MQVHGRGGQRHGVQGGEVQGHGAWGAAVCRCVGAGARAACGCGGARVRVILIRIILIRIIMIRVVMIRVQSRVMIRVMMIRVTVRVTGTARECGRACPIATHDRHPNPKALTTSLAPTLLIKPRTLI